MYTRYIVCITYCLKISTLKIRWLKRANLLFGFMKHRKRTILCYWFVKVKAKCPGMLPILIKHKMSGTLYIRLQRTTLLSRTVLHILRNIQMQRKVNLNTCYNNAVSLKHKAYMNAFTMLDSFNSKTQHNFWYIQYWFK